MIYKDKIDGEIDQGDILYPVKIQHFLSWWPDGHNYPIVILTPTCNIFQKKVDFHRFTILLPFPTFFLNLVKGIVNIPHFPNITFSKTQKTKIEDKLNKAIKNTWPRYHFLPKQSVFNVDRIVDFEVILSAPINFFSPEQRICRIDSPYKEELIHRYSHHTMRIGTKDIPRGEINKIISDCFSLLHQNSD